MSNQLENNVIVLRRLLLMVESDNDFDQESLSDGLNEMLDELAFEGIFGDSQERDPRGDFRNGQWDMWEIEDEQY